MKLSARENKTVTLDITPMIDIVFLLLIFFMVSTTFDHNSEINITLPQASEEKLSGRIEAVYVAIDANGDIYVNKEKLSDRSNESLKQALNEAAVTITEPPVVISADEQATHQSVISVMDAARQIGMVKITFAVKKTLDNNNDNTEQAIE